MEHATEKEKEEQKQRTLPKLRCFHLKVHIQRVLPQNRAQNFQFKAIVWEFTKERAEQKYKTMLTELMESAEPELEKKTGKCLNIKFKSCTALAMELDHIVYHDSQKPKKEEQNGSQQ